MYQLFEPPIVADVVRRHGGEPRGRVSSAANEPNRGLYEIDAVLDVAGTRIHFAAATLCSQAHSDDLNQRYGTTLALHVPELGRLELAVRPHGPFLGRPFTQDLELGDAAFDDRYVVEGSHAELVRLWLDDAVRQAILATYDPKIAMPCELRLDGAGNLTIQGEVAAGGLDRLERLLTLARTIAQQPDVLAQRLADRAAGLGVERGGRLAIDGPPVLRWRGPDGEATAAIRYADDLCPLAAPWLRLRICVDASALGPHAALVLWRGALPAPRRKARRPLPAIREGLPPPWSGIAANLDDITPRLGRLARLLDASPATRVIRTATDVLVDLPGLEHGAQALASATAIASQLIRAAAPSTGPYR